MSKKKRQRYRQAIVDLYNRGMVGKTDPVVFCKAGYNENIALLTIGMWAILFLFLPKKHYVLTANENQIRIIRINKRTLAPKGKVVELEHADIKSIYLHPRDYIIISSTKGNFYFMVKEKHRGYRQTQDWKKFGQTLSLKYPNRRRTRWSGDLLDAIIDISLTPKI